jgi:hypothetical protein
MSLEEQISSSMMVAVSLNAHGRFETGTHAGFKNAASVRR